MITKEKVSGHKIKISWLRFICPTCGSACIERTLGYSKVGHNHLCENRSNDKVNFYCRKCNCKIKTLYDKKQGIEITTKEYFKLLHNCNEV